MIQENAGDHPVKQIEIRPYTGKQIAGFYNISTKMLRSWLKPHHELIGLKVGHYFNPRQVRVIFDKLGKPKNLPLLLTLTLLSECCRLLPFQAIA